MINGRMWLVVNRTVGLRVIIGGVALTSLVIHAAVLTNTTWKAGFYQGGGSRMWPAAEVVPTTPVRATLAAVQFAPQVGKAAKE